MSPSTHLQSYDFSPEMWSGYILFMQAVILTVPSFRGMNCSNWCKRGSIVFVFPMKKTTLEHCYLTSDVPLPQFGLVVLVLIIWLPTSSQVESFLMLAYFPSEQGRNQVWPMPVSSAVSVILCPRFTSPVSLAVSVDWLRLTDLEEGCQSNFAL